MICTRDLLRAGVVFAGLLLAACTEQSAEIAPIDKARAALERNDPISAEVELRGLLAAGVEPRELSALMGEAELQQGSLAEARQWLGKREFSAETIAHGNHILGRLEMVEGNLPLAGQAFDRALAVGGDDPELWVDIARLRYRGGEQAQAFEASAKAVELGPENPQALLFHGQLVRDVEGMAAALPWFEQALERSPGNRELLAEYAATLGELNKAEAMLEAVREVTRSDPGNRQAQYLQSVMAARAGNFDLALALLQRSGEIERNVPAALLLSAIIDLERGNYASSAQTLDRLSSMQPDNRRIDPLLARALSLGRNDTELIYRFAKAASRPSASPYLQTLVARSYEAIGDREKAAFLYDLAARATRDTFGVIEPANTMQVAGTGRDGSGAEILTFVRAAIAGGNQKSARDASAGFARRAPGSGDARLLLGDAYLASNQLGPALGAYRNAAAIRRPWPLAYKMAAIMTAQGGDPEAAVFLDTFLRGEPANVETLWLLAWQNAQRSNWEASALYADSAMMHGAARDPSLLAIRARAALELGEFERALSYAETAHDLQPMNAIAARTLADVYRAAGVEAQLADIAEAKARLLENS